MIAAGIRRGLAAGLLAGILAGAFALVVGHDPMAEAIGIEESRQADHADGPAAQQDDPGASPTDHDGSVAGRHHVSDDVLVHDDAVAGAREGAGDDAPDQEQLYSRTTQQVLLPIATVILGLGLGGLFGLAFALLRPHRRRTGEWQASLLLGGAAWSVTVLLPMLTFPANPPGVGDAASADTRTQGYLLAIGTGLLAIGALYGLARRLARTTLRAPARQAVVGAATLVTGAVLVALLPSAVPGDGFPAELLWRFRLISLGSQTLLWVGIAVGVGLLWERAVHGTLTRQREDGR